MKSLEKQLQRSLAFVLALILLGLLLIANLSTRNVLEEFVTARLELDANRLIESLVINKESLTVKSKQINPIYNSPNSGHYFAIQLKNKQTVFSPSLQNVSLPSLSMTTPEITVHNIPGPQGQHLIIWSKNYNKNGQNIVVSVAEDMSLLMKNRQYFTVLFFIIGLIGFVLMLTLQRLVIRRLFKHLDHIRQEIKQIESGERQQLSEKVPTEIYPLVKEFNSSLSQMQQRMIRSRNSLGNLAHALKTPLSLLIQQLDSNTFESEQAKKHANRIHQLTDRELKRARMAGLGNTSQRFDPREELPTLIDVLKQAHNKSKLNVKLSIAENINTFGDREDMLELVGNLMDNAYKWAESNIYCSLFLEEQEAENESTIYIVIEDDGAEQAPQELDLLTQRGIRLDESVEGHGLGLAICKDIAKLYGGEINFTSSKDLGGLQVKVSLPGNFTSQT